MSFNFGGAATSQAGGFGFGANTANKPMGLAQPNVASGTGGLSFGMAPPAASAGGFGFGSTTITPVGGAATSANMGFGLGSITTSTPAMGGGSVSFGGFGSQTATTTPAFGLAGGMAGMGAPRSMAPTLSFGGGTTTTPAFGLGQPAVSAPMGGLGGGFGTLGGLSAPASSAGFGLSQPGVSNPAFGTMAPASLAAPNLGLPGALGLGGTTAPAPFAGLGGAPNALAGSTNAGADAKNGSKTAKENQVPNELAQTVEEFKRFTKEERSISSDIAHTSSKIHQKIREETDGLLNLVKILSAGLAKNKVQLDKLKLDAAQEILNVEIAQRTKDTPPALQFENSAPYDYFSRLVNKFETQMLAYRRQIGETEQHLLTLTEHHAVTPNDIALALQKLHASFTTLAGKYQKIHEQIQIQKDIYIHQHRLRHGVSSNLFPQKATSPVILASSKVPTTIGPSPFTGQQDLMSMAKASLLSSTQSHQSAPPTFGLGSQSTYPSLSQPQAMSSPFASNTGGGGLFGTPGTLGVSSANTSTPGLFGNAMSPFGASTALVAGNKRGKH